MWVAGRYKAFRMTISRDERKGHMKEINIVELDEALRKEAYILYGEIQSAMRGRLGLN